MEVIPAIEIKAGKSIRQTQPKIDQAHLFTTDPVKIAKRWAEEGATRLHIHDVDGARTGAPENREVVRDLIRRLGLPTHYSGGVRSPETVERLFAMGVTRVVLTLQNLTDAYLVDSMRRFGDKIIVAVGQAGGGVPVFGHPQGAAVPFVEILNQLKKLGALQILLTPVGDVNGPAADARLVSEVVRAVALPTSIWGKISVIPEIEALSDAGAESIILGQSIYDGSIRYPHAISVATPL